MDGTRSAPDKLDLGHDLDQEIPQNWLRPPKLTPVLGLWIRSLLSSECSSAHIHLHLNLGSLHAVVLPTLLPGSKALTSAVRAQLSSCSCPSQTPWARAQFALGLTRNEGTHASRLRGRAVCFHLKPRPRNCASRLLKAAASVKRMAQLLVTARRELALRVGSQCERAGTVPLGCLGLHHYLNRK